MKFMLVTEQGNRIAVAEYDEHSQHVWSAIWPKAGWSLFRIAIQGICEQFTK